jgi:hypothetical protein
VVNAILPEGTFCQQPFLACTYNACDDAGNCVKGQDINGEVCTTDDDCTFFKDETAECVDGFCVCISCETNLPCEDERACRAHIYLNVDPSDKPNPNCFAKGEKVTIDVDLVPDDAASKINGGQFMIAYDPACLDFLSISPGGDPFTFEIIESVDEAAGEIFYAVGVDPMGGVGTFGPATMATMSFEKVSGCTNCFLYLTGEKVMDTFLTDDTGQPICVVPYPSKWIHENDKLSISVPDDVKVNVDCDAATAVVTWDEPYGDSSCFDPDCDPQQADKCYTTNLDCWGYGPDGQDLTHLANGGGEMPQGVSTFGCTVTSKICGDSLDAGWTVTVNEWATLDVEVQLEPVISDLKEPLIRCINFEIFADCVQDPVLVQAEIPFGSKWDFIGHYTDVLKVPAIGNYVCITAMDQLHSLRAVSDVICAEDGIYYAEFKGDPKYFGGSWLTGGNLDAWKKDNPNASHDVIDILDFGQFVAMYLTTPGGNTTCDMKHGYGDPPMGHGDINGDGIVDGFDFAYIMRNFLQESKDSCCPDGIGGVNAPLSEVSVRDLAAWGMRDLVVADLNGDGLVNTDDMAAFLGGATPVTGKVQTRGNLRGR